MSPLYYFTVDKDSHLRILSKTSSEELAGGMVNVLRAEQDALMKAYHAYPHVRLVLDSGAPQGYANVSAYAESIKRLAWRFEWFSSMDVLGDQDASEKQYEQLCSRLPDDLRTRVTWVYQCCPGQSLRARRRQLYRLRDALPFHKRIGLGGFVPILRRPQGVALALKYLQEIGEVFLDASLENQAHGFGWGSPALLLWAASQSWIGSLDSGKWLVAFKAHELLRTFGDQCHPEKLGLVLSPEECAANNLRVILNWLTPGASLQLLLPPARRTFPKRASQSVDDDALSEDNDPRAYQMSLWKGTPSL